MENVDQKSQIYIIRKDKTKSMWRASCQESRVLCEGCRRLELLQSILQDAANFDLFQASEQSTEGNFLSVGKIKRRARRQNLGYR